MDPSTTASDAGINICYSSLTSSFMVTPPPTLSSTTVAIMSASAVTTIIVSLASIIPLSNTQQLINLKLTNINYLYWCMQMKPYLIGHDAFSFVDGFFSCPSPQVMPSDDSATSVIFDSGIN